MYFDVITIEPVVINWVFALILLCVGLAMLLAALLLRICGFIQLGSHDNMRGAKRNGNVAKTLAFWALAPLGAFALIAFVIATWTAPGQLGAHQHVALEEQLGYSRINVMPQNEGDNPSIFIASDSEGKYVSGKLVEIQLDTFIIVLDDESTP